MGAAQVQGENHVSGQAVALGQADQQQSQKQNDEKKREFRNAVQCSNGDRTGPTQEGDHLYFSGKRTLAGTRNPPNMGRSLRKTNTQQRVYELSQRKPLTH
ncbi:MAG: hypothetical protein WDM89_01935 [Rhizomicrobium sp.]